MKNESMEANLNKLCQAFMKLRSNEEVRIFLKDLLSNPEIESIGERFNIALLLSKGLPYVEIQRETGASSATIAKVSENLKYGNDGFRLVIDRMRK